MTAMPFSFPIFRAFTTTGTLGPLAGGLLHTFKAGTSTPLAVYQDDALTVPHTNPVILDSNGQATIYLGPNAYKMRLEDSTGAVQPGWPIDGLQKDTDTLRADLAASSGSSLVGFIQSGSGAVARDIEDKLWDSVSVFEWFTDTERNDVRTRTGSIDVSAKIMAAHEDCRLLGRKLYFPSGVYLWSTPQTTVHTLAWEGESPEVYTGIWTSRGVQIKCTTTGASTYALTVNVSGFENSFYMRNLRFTGGDTASNALYLNNVGNTGSIENVCIDSFTGWGLNSGYIQDIKFWNLFIYHCAVTPATYGLGLGALSNLLHFYGCRVEACLGLIRADSVTGVFFDSPHFEQPIDSAYTASPIYITSSSNIKITGGIAGANSVSRLVTLTGQAADNTAYYMRFVNCIDLELANITFIYGLADGGSKYLSIESNSDYWHSSVHGCTFMRQDCRVYGVNVQYCSFYGNTIEVFDDQTTNVFKVASFRKSTCRDNNVFCGNPSSTTKTSGYVFYADSNIPENILGCNKIVVSKLFAYANSNWATDNLGSQNTSSAAPVAGVYDMELYPERTAFTLGSNNVSSISNTKRGQIVEITNIPGYSATVTHGASLLLKGATNATVAANNVLTLKNLYGDGVMYEIARNF